MPGDGIPEIGRFALKSDQQGLEFVNPRECSFADEAALVHDCVEMAFPSTLHCFSIAFIFRNIGFDSTVPQQLACCTCIEATIHIEHGALVVQSAAFHVSKDVLQLLLKRIAVIMVAGDDTRCGNNIPISIRYRQDVARLGLLAPLICYFFAPFFAALWLPSRLSSDKFNSPRIEIILASKRRWKLPSLLHFRK